MGFGGVPTIVSGQESTASSDYSSWQWLCSGVAQAEIAVLPGFACKRKVSDAALDLEGDGQRSDAAAWAYDKAKYQVFQEKSLSFNSHAMLLCKEAILQALSGELRFHLGCFFITNVNSRMAHMGLSMRLPVSQASTLDLPQRWMVHLHSTQCEIIVEKKNLVSTGQTSPPQNPVPFGPIPQIKWPLKTTVSYPKNPLHGVEAVHRAAIPDKDVPCIQDSMSEDCESDIFPGTCIVKSLKMNKKKTDLK